MNTGEKAPQDMAVWRAILEGDAWLTLRGPNFEARKVRRLLNWAHYAYGDPLMPRSKITGRYLFYPDSQVAHVLRLRRRIGRGAVVWRVVSFTHPFTGGRAVYSEIID